MATKTEKLALGLDETADDQQVLDRIQDLIAAKELLEGDNTPTATSAPVGGVRIALVGLRGQDRYVGGLIIGSDVQNPLVLDLEAFRAETDTVGGKVVNVGEQRLAEILADPATMKLRSDAPLTPTSAVRRYKPQ